jgi:hypothetical protein
VVGSEITSRILDAYEEGDLIPTCAWCNRVNFDGEWLLASRFALTVLIDAPNVLSHSICPGCTASIGTFYADKTLAPPA